jgi:short-subunit dehydrogenase
MENWALITGATAGIGYEFAKLFAADHFNLVLVARHEERLNKIAEELKARHGISARVLPKDLSSPVAPKELFEALHEVPISILVNNAGFGWLGQFAEGRLELAREIMRVNMDALVELTHLFLQPMLKRGEGRILNVASTAAFQPGPLTAIYYASKAFVFSFSVALAEELAGTGVQVTTYCPGGTRTEFFARAGMEKAVRRLPLMSAEKAAKIGYRGFMKGKCIVIPGMLNRLMSPAAKAMPSRWTAKIVRKINGG